MILMPMSTKICIICIMLIIKLCLVLVIYKYIIFILYIKTLSTDYILWIFLVLVQNLFYIFLIYNEQKYITVLLSFFANYLAISNFVSNEKKFPIRGDSLRVKETQKLVDFFRLG